MPLVVLTPSRAGTVSCTILFKIFDHRLLPLSPSRFTRSSSRPDRCNNRGFDSGNSPRPNVRMRFNASDRGLARFRSIVVLNIGGSGSHRRLKRISVPSINSCDAGSLAAFQASASQCHVLFATPSVLYLLTSILPRFLDIIAGTPLTSALVCTPLVICSSLYDNLCVEPEDVSPFVSFLPSFVASPGAPADSFRTLNRVQPQGLARFHIECGKCFEPAAPPFLTRHPLLNHSPNPRIQLCTSPHVSNFRFTRRPSAFLSCFVPGNNEQYLFHGLIRTMEFDWEQPVRRVVLLELCDGQIEVQISSIVPRNGAVIFY
ncbi:hypothetical protein DFH08DRAFT_824069 [Mycena albidolilacea]|uniref:Uncharacterized protein n=1 Tax=Mycena albidolilacea TaxID=1033008 RepID=A0AAD6Z584_9AGAR|nr:hypothetical protein DFH08DRAFT_824069 [Mycena albidolilacea]